jgi:tRNA (guanine37-N1)-methyltransferase
VLRSGDHGRIARWRRARAIRRTLDVRPDLIESRGGVTPEERSLMVEFGLEDDRSGA